MSPESTPADLCSSSRDFRANCKTNDPRVAQMSPESTQVDFVLFEP